MELSTFGVVLTFATELENGAKRFYTEAAQGERYSVAKETFAALAGEHDKRKAMLARLRQEGDVSDSDTSPSRLPISSLKPSDYLTVLRLESETGYTDVLRLGVEVEEKSYKFYLDSASHLKSQLPWVSRDFEKLARGNNIHKERLQALQAATTGETKG